jgi:thiamine pyrophosphate-dependent acetolactate synthase large subunit-like protein
MTGLTKRKRRAIMSDLTEVLRYAGVARVYGVIEDSLTPFVDAVRRTDGMAWVEVRDEQAAALAAADEAQATGQLAVCADLIHGLSDAHRTGAPVLAVASRVSTKDSGGGALHEVHPERLFAECSHYCELVSHPSQISWLARTAMQHALVRGGVAALLLDPPVARERRDLAKQFSSSRSCGDVIRGRQAPFGSTAFRCTPRPRPAGVAANSAQDVRARADGLACLDRSCG